jgi:hypothetical protein
LIGTAAVLKVTFRTCGTLKCSHASRVFAGEFGDCCSADVTIITAGLSQSGPKSRLDGPA